LTTAGSRSPQFLKLQVDGGAESRSIHLRLLRWGCTEAYSTSPIDLDILQEEEESEPLRKRKG